MGMDQALQSFLEGLQNNATIKKLFGDSVSVEGRTLIPVARISYGFGGGSGPAPHRTNGGTAPGQEKPEEGAGGGGGFKAVPLGVIEVSGEATRYVPVGIGKKLLAAGLAGFLVGLWFHRR